MKALILTILLAAIAGPVYSSPSSMDRKILNAITENDALQIIEHMEDYHKQKMIERFERFKISCDTCKTTSTFIGEDVFGNDQVKKYVLKIVELGSPCSRVPTGILRNTCAAAVTAIFDLIWEQQTKYWTSAKICYQINICNSSELTASQLQKMQDNDDIHSRVMELMALKKFKNNKFVQSLLCRVCEISTDLISDIIFENEQIKETALNFIKDHSPCVNMSILTQTACFDALTAAFQFVWQEADKELSYGRLCKRIRLCNGTNSAMTLQMVEDSDSCQFCEVMVSTMQPAVEQNLNIQETLENLDKSCSDLKCKAFIFNYGIKVAQMLEDKMSIQQICKAVDYCL